MALLTCSQIHAADILWDDISGGLFSDPNNWNPTQVPTTGDDAIFDLNADPNGYTVTFDGNETNTRLILNTDVVMFDLGGFTYTLDGADMVDRGVTLGDVSSDLAILDLFNGMLDSQNAVIGNALGATGFAIVNIDATWTNSLNLFVGKAGDGNLDIFGTVSNHFAVIAELPGSTGTALVDGSGSWMNSGQLLVGESGNGTLAITGGGTVSSTTGHVGFDPNSTGSVTVDPNGKSPLTHLSLRETD